MNFFEQQEKARRQSRWLIVSFIGVVILIITAVNLLVLTVLSLGASVDSHSVVPQLSSFIDPAFLQANLVALITTSAATGGLMGIASLVKTVSLRGGGGKVAKDMGGTQVSPDTTDPLRRRLYNVVEEIALASGTPVPDVYVMESEHGINAFAAGYRNSDAAVAVTQGCLEKLNRSELQGVIAHEFSHIFNGDMRINIRLMGVLFGILVIAIIGRKILYSNRHRMSSSSRENNSGAIMAIGLGLLVVGYIGLFFTRWIKASLSRQREYLADSSAVQFTRDPDGIAGALKKIAAYQHKSYLNTDPEEVSHMLFSKGYRSLMFATHPPLEKRITRIEKGFDASEINSLAKKLAAQERREHVQAQLAEQENNDQPVSKHQGGMFDVDSMIDNIGQPDFQRILAAAILAADMPDSLTTSARSLEWVAEVLFFCLLDKDEKRCELQLKIVHHQMGDISVKKLQHLIDTNQRILPKHRLPMLEICFPTLKRRPLKDIEQILQAINMLSVIDNKVDSFEFLLSRMVNKYLVEAKHLSKQPLHGYKKCSDCVDEISRVVSILASHGKQDKGNLGLQEAQRAYRNGMESMDIRHTNIIYIDSWQQQLDQDLIELNLLSPKEKNTLVTVLANTVLSDEELVTEEHEMLRAICCLINVPLPILFKEESKV